ncbi:MAG: hypothetical protein AAGG09_19890 [Pseudomonadota bacterium]
MAFVDTIAERVATETFETAEALGQPDLVDEVSRTIGELSPTMQEAYNTAIRYLRAEARAKAILQARAARTD